MANIKRAHVSGVRDFKLKLKALDKKVRNKIVSQAMRAAAKVILAEAKALAPKKTGFMSKQIKIKVGKRKKDQISFRVQVGSQNFVGKAFYGAMQEFGWKTGSIKHHRTLARKKTRNFKGSRKIEGKHFMERAFDSKVAQASNIMLTQLKTGIESTGK